MITISKTRDGKFVARGTCKVNSDPQYKEFDSGKTLTSFFGNADATGKGKDKKYDSYKINAWEEWSDYANMLQKGDLIYVEGECKKDDYYSQKNNTDEFMINVTTMFIATIGVEVLRLRMLVDDLRNRLGENQIDPATEYRDIDPKDTPFGAGDDFESGI
jgi:hypothetical protein